MLNKYARDDPDWTPNNYDITINKEDVEDVLLHLPLHSIIELNKEIKELVPLTKKVHLIVENDSQYFTPILRFSTSLYTNKGDKLL